MKKNNQKGFTLVELMIVVLLSAIVLGAIAIFYRSQQRSYIAQEEVAEAQQELRAALEIASREIRNAGHDTDPGNSAGAGFIVAGPFQVQFSMDLTDDAGTGDPDGDILDPNENVTYGFSPAPLPDDAGDVNGDGIADAGAAAFRRESNGGGMQELSSNIQAISFAYAYDNNADGQLETKNVAGNDVVIWAVPNGAGAWVDLDIDNNGAIDNNDATPAPIGLANAAQLGQIRAVRIWILARASRPDPEFVDTTTIYKVGANLIPVPAVNDNFRRRLLSVNIRSRNMGLQ